MSGNALDVALWDARRRVARGTAHAWKRIGLRPFDHERRLSTVLTDAPDGTASWS